MTVQRLLTVSVLASVLMVATPVVAQTTVTSADIQRLQDDVYQAGNDISRLRNTSSTSTSRMQDELDELRDEVIYLKVKLRKEGNVGRREYTELRDRLQDFRTRARGEASGVRSGSGTGTGSGTGSGSSPIYDESARTTRNGQGVIPAGQEIDVRLMSQLSSDNAQVEDRIEATTVVDLYQGERVLVPAGSIMRGIVTSVNRASRTDRKGSLTVEFNQLNVRGRTYPMRGLVVEAIESEGIKGEIGRIGAGSAVGAIIGGIVGGVKGALLGVLIGGGGTMIATEGKDVTLPPGTILRVRMDSPPEIR
jgi:hypothetical protein